jgi:hypothetical protein
MNGQAGKGDAYRPVDPKKWDENYERIFGKKKKIKKSKRLKSIPTTSKQYDANQAKS